MSEMMTAVLVGLVTMWVLFKVLKFAIKIAFLGALAAGAFAAYVTYVAV